MKYKILSEKCFSPFLNEVFGGRVFEIIGRTNSLRYKRRIVSVAGLGICSWIPDFRVEQKSVPLENRNACQYCSLPETEIWSR
jgi:hypothetical protein